MSYDGPINNSITLSPRMGLIVGHYDNRGIYLENSANGFLIKGNLQKVYGHNQALYVGNGNISYPGHFGYVDGISLDYVTEGIIPSAYGFENEYFFTPKTAQVETSQGNNVVVNYLRTGYIKYQGNYLTLSAKTQGAGTAYIEYLFRYP